MFSSFYDAAMTFNIGIIHHAKENIETTIALIKVKTLFLSCCGKNMWPE